MIRSSRAINRGQRPRFAFTIIELLAVISIIGLLVAIVVPALSRGRLQAQSTGCLSNLRELSRGLQIYADENDGALVASRQFERGTEEENLYDVGNGMKNRPRWMATIGVEIGLYGFNTPDRNDSRQDYDQKAYACPTEPTWVDERNHGYGYNYQFLGNGRELADTGRYRNFPVLQSQITSPSGTVVAGDSMGTAAAFAANARAGYSNNGTELANKGNHGCTLDPPRLTDRSDRGPGDSPNDPRSAVDPRHGKKANVVFFDSHAEGKTPISLGYRLGEGGCFVMSDVSESCFVGSGGGTVGSFGNAGSGAAPEAAAQQNLDPPTNRLFSGNGRDQDPPRVY